jgi:UDP-glucose 4-epimerase
MKVLITGGAGFVGSHLVDRLLERGDKVLVIDNYATGRRDNLVPHPNLEVVEGSIADAALVEQVFNRFSPDFTAHAAASYKDPNNWAEDTRTNVLGTALITQASIRTEVKRLIYFQTALCYGLHPIEQPITLSHPILPDGSSYAISKTAGEHYINLSGIDFISFRLAKKKCFVMNTRRDFIFIDDLVDVVIKALDGAGEKGYYHVSSGSDFSIKELYEATIDALGLQDKTVEERERNPDDVFSILLDPSKTNKDFSWKTTTPLSEGVEKTIAYYKKYGISETFTHLKLSE